MADSSRGKVSAHLSRSLWLSRIPAAFLLVLLVCLMVFQGGFFQESTACALVIYCVSCAIYLSVRFVLAWNNKGVDKTQAPALLLADCDVKGIFGKFAIPIGAFAIASFFIVSTFVQGLPIYDLMHSLAWVLAGIASISCILLDSKSKAWLIDGIAWIGVISSVVGFAAFSEAVFIPGGFHAGRLQFFFQYANAAGAWFAVSVLLCMTNRKASLRRLAFFPITALLFTQSMGSICMLVVVVAVFFSIELLNARRMKDQAGSASGYRDASMLVFQVILAALSFLTLKYDLLLGAIVYLSAAICCVSLYKRVLTLINKTRKQKTVFIVAFAFCLIAAVLFVVFDYSRVMQSLATFVERVVQAKDALFLFGQNLILGIGPDQWQYRYFEIRSEEYISTQVHNAYLQLGLDAGVLAVLIFIAMFAYSIIRSLRNGNTYVWAPTLFLFLHAFVDFDMSFSFFVVLSCLLMSLCLTSCNVRIRPKGGVSGHS